MGCFSQWDIGGCGCNGGPIFLVQCGGENVDGATVTVNDGSTGEEIAGGTTGTDGRVQIDVPDGATYFVTWCAKDDRILGEADRDKVVSALMHFDGQRCRTFAACVMPDHVHWIVKPFDPEKLIAVIHRVVH